MNAILALVVICGMLPSSGCRSARDNQIDLLESELRAQENYIYELEDYLVDYSEKLRQYRCMEMGSMVVSKESSSEPELAMPQRSRTTTNAPTTKELLKSLDKPTTTTAPAAAPAVEEEVIEEEIIEESPENLEVPELEIGEPMSADDVYEQATPLSEADIEGTLLADGSFIPDPSAYQTAAISEEGREAEMEIPAVADAAESYEEEFDEEITPTETRDPERLVISHVFRNSSDAESQSLLSVVEARDASNEPADFNGKVSLMVMQVVDEKPRRVKRWDFTAEETEAAWQSSNLGDGLHLELPLESVQLPTGPLELWVRLETNDGRKLLSQHAFEQQTLVDIDQAEEHLAEKDNNVDGASHLTEANSLRGSKPRVETTPLPSAQSDVKTEPQWRAATHYSAGSNSGFGTTATAQRWSSRPIGSKAATETPAEPQPKSSQQQWRARK